MPLTNFLNGAPIGGELSRFSPNVVSANPDVHAYSRLFAPKSPATNQLSLTAWRSTPVGVGTNAVSFVVQDLRARPRADANSPWATGFAPVTIRAGWSKINATNSFNGGQYNVLLTFGYMQVPPAGWPAPTGPVNANDNKGFFFFDNPIGQTIPAPLRYANSIWTVVLLTDAPTFLVDSIAPATFEWSAYITTHDNSPISMSPTGVISS